MAAFYYDDVLHEKFIKKKGFFTIFFTKYELDRLLLADSSGRFIRGHIYQKVAVRTEVYF
jgi:hypothetical protein